MPNVETATIEELNKFINEFRKIVGVELLEEIVPSEPCSSTKCIIAQNLMPSANDTDRGASIAASVEPKGDSSDIDKWVIILPNKFADTIDSIAMKLGLEVDSYTKPTVKLPENLAKLAYEYDLTYDDSFNVIRDTLESFLDSNYSDEDEIDIEGYLIENKIYQEEIDFAKKYIMFYDKQFRSLKDKFGNNVYISVKNNKIVLEK